MGKNGTPAMQILIRRISRRIETFCWKTTEPPPAGAYQHQKGQKQDALGPYVNGLPWSQLRCLIIIVTGDILFRRVLKV